jgi:hypothetical protein
MSEQETLAPWHDDRLGYRELGETFTNLVTSITDTRVISIEAGFGHGKTYFRKNWAQHLRDAGEVVIEIDAMLSDHSGEPVVTFLGAMLEQIATADPSNLEKAKVAVKKMGGVVVRAGLKAVLRSGADEIIDFAAEQSDSATLDDIIKGVGGTLSDVAAGMIDSQLATENARKLELPKQLGILRDLLTEEKEAKRVIVIVDELDRCHPEYAIALLEAMKVVFNLDGFVFCLMVNAHALERLADHRFGKHEQGERYLDKFVDMRLRLRPNEDLKKIEAGNLVLGLPDVVVPFASAADFGKDAAALLAANIVGKTTLSMRQIVSVVKRLEVTIRTHPDQAIDLPLLVYLAFLAAAGQDVETLSSQMAQEVAAAYDFLRGGLVPKRAEELRSSASSVTGTFRDNVREENAIARVVSTLNKEMPELLSEEILGRYVDNRGQRFVSWYALLVLLAPNYIPSHIQMLNAALAISADT